MLFEEDLVYPVTAAVMIEGAAPELAYFESVEEWQREIEQKMNMAMHLLSQEIVPADEDKAQCDMFNPFAIQFKFEKSGQRYGSVVSEMRMPVPARTMLQ